ncbi:type I restriction-modification system subunit M N-terminal domain-containing protein, partial [Bacteroides xylanisolvens]
FYKYLSDKLLYHVGEVLESDPKLPLQHNQKLYEREYDTNLDLQDEIKNSLSFILEPKHTFTYILNEINGEARDDKGIKTFQISDLADAFNDIESTSHDFEGLFQ